ncbi:bifunctional serine/threonine-protein kinase/glutamate ABC transporter substrate-binding protein [Streptomyces sp. NPDC017254]|uniref:bifunctional serine/threonine-protein kinase/glutamate ABC transporter substrate-binding protein n=1 Tax=unclassified Streptomyces TaxID=2593676 RepID=UPI0037ADC1A3
MGTVWRARDLALHREVALKEVRPPDPALAEYDPEGARELRIRVLREARALARVAHPQVVTIHHIVDGGEGTYPWLVMELVAGGSLQDRLDRGVLTPGAAATLGRGILAGLRAAHAAGIQHRDIKPANVLLRPDGLPVLTDFGIAAIHGATALTAAGSIIGTPDYMAPERVGGEEGGPAADLWSLAMTLYVAVEGHHPLRRANTLATLAAVLGEDVPPPRRAGPLTRVLTSVLVRDPGARPDGGSLDRLLADVEAEANAETRPQAEPPAPGLARSQPEPLPQDQDHAPLQAPEAVADGGRPAVDGEPRDAIPPGGGAQAAAAPPFSVDATADTATAFPLAPPPPPRPPLPPSAHKPRTGVYAAAAGAVVVLGGVLVWNLLPLGGGQEGGEGDRVAGRPGGQSASSSSTPSTPSTPSTDASAASPTGGGPKITIGIRFDQPGLGLKKPDGTYAGLDVDVANYLARALGHAPAEVVWKEVRSATRESALAGGDVDLVVATYTINEARKKSIDFAGPYLVAHQDVLLPTGSSVRTPTDLNGKKVCAATGSTSALMIPARLAPQAQVVTRDTYSRCVDDLASGAVDALSTDDALLAGYAAQDTYKGRFKLAGFRVSDERYGVGLPKGSPLRGRVTTALERMISDGSWRKAVEKNLPLLGTDTPPQPE